MWYERIKTELDSSPVVLFMKGTPDFPQCGFSAQTVAALRAVGADFKHVNIFEEPELREALKRYSNWPTYPQLYVNGELVGGCDIALEMYRSGELKKLLERGGRGRRLSRPAGAQGSSGSSGCRLQRRLLGRFVAQVPRPAECARALLGRLVTVAQAVAHEAEDSAVRSAS